MASTSSPTNIIDSMGSTSSCASPPSNSHTIRYDVFLSFRGEDTRYTFTDHLYKALLGEGIRTFRANDGIQLGQKMKPEIKDAIIGSRASIVVLSENYAKSRWCLDELSLILEQKRQRTHFVLPVFYRVDPSDVKQGRSFPIQGSTWTVDNTTRWNAALREVADLNGMVLSGYNTYETDFIEDVVETINSQLDLNLNGMEAVYSQLDLKQLSTATQLTEMETVNSQLDLKQLSTPDHLTGVETVNRQLYLKQLSTSVHLIGMETQVEAINSWLKSGQSNVIAICGMGGSGKTTLAKYIYNLNKLDFESNSFVEDIGKHKHDVLEQQKQLLRDILGGKEIKVSSVLEGAHKIVEILQMKKVFIVLDDIDDEDKLSILFGTNTFPTQSKIIITTRLLNINTWFGSISCRCWVHKVKLLNDLESLELLSWHAFRSKIPMEGFEELAKQLAQYCGGNPLALKVLGSSLFVDEDPHKRNYMIDIWRGKLNSVLKGDLDYNIQCVLQKSFDSLPVDSHKELFLHIACFFIGESRKFVETILKDELSAPYGILTLINRCLLIVSPDTSKLMMHQLHQDMGRKIVCEASKDPSKRTIVWHDDAYHVLRKGDGSYTIKGLALDMPKVKQAMKSESLALKTSSLARMKNLKLLQLKYVTLTGTYNNFPDLRWLCWHGCHLKAMPSGLLMSSLVAIDMSHGDMETFEAPMALNSLKILNLKECYKLVSICSLYFLPKLEELLLSYCSSLTHLCKSIGDLKSLALLDLKGCNKLLKASSKNKKVVSSLKYQRIDEGNSKQPLFSLPCSLKSLYLDFCITEYYEDVQVEFHAQSFLNLCLGCNLFVVLPISINLKMLRILNLYSCPYLKSLPCIPSELEELYIDWCRSLKIVTFQSGRFRLQQFSYEGCSKLSEVQGLFKLVPIAQINEPDLVQHMQWIKTYEHHKVDLVGDVITLGRERQIQMLYEYGIMSTYVQGSIQGQSMATYEYTSSSSFLSFRVPLHPMNKIQGLTVSCLYRSSVSKDNDRWTMLAKISNRTKGLTWVYNPLVYGKPSVDEDVVWLSYWPIGNVLDAGDEVLVEIIWEKVMMIVTRCDASLVYIDGEVNEEENSENKSIQDGVIGGDLSEFEVTTGGYYLSRRDLFGSETLSRLKGLFDDNVHHPDTHGWKKTHQSRMSNYRTCMDFSGYDLFLSLEGEDTCHTFTDHLYQALLRAGIRTFRDNDVIDRHHELAPEIRTAINESRACIVVLSENYANSRWCLDELCLILEQRKKLNRFVLPVFYHVDPSDVANQRGSFSIEGSKWTVNDVERWKAALTEVANLKGMVVSGYEKDFVAVVVDRINHELETRQTLG